MTSKTEQQPATQSGAPRPRRRSTNAAWKWLLFGLLSIGSHFTLSRTEGWLPIPRKAPPEEKEIEIELIAPPPAPKPVAKILPPVEKPPEPKKEKKKEPKKETKKLEPKKPEKPRPPRRKIKRYVRLDKPKPSVAPKPSEKPEVVDLLDNEINLESETVEPQRQPRKPRVGSNPRVIPDAPKDGKPTVTAIHRVTAMPRILRSVRPAYPERLREIGVYGTVRLLVRVRPDGSTEFVRFLERVHPILDQNSKNAALKMRFAPGMILRKKVTIEIPLAFTFNLR
ncbi:MAG: TonB family protein [Myxococcales bacterium]|nr:TonB family protein [Myxococcales bacterium]